VKPVILLQILVFAAGLAVVAATVLSAIRTFILPRGVPDLLVGAVFGAVRQVFNLRLRFARTYAQRDRIMALYAPITLFVLLPVYLALVLVGYMAMYWAAGISALYDDFAMSGSSLLTLGFASGSSGWHTFLAFTEATIGLILVALLIAYLPTMYGAFSRREILVTQLASRAGTPPSAQEFLLRVHRIGGLRDLVSFWMAWETFFADIEESHTSLSALVFFRSPAPDHSWITAAGAVLDTASLMASTLDLPRQPQAELCIRAGFLALRRIADFFQVEHPPDPHFPDQLITVTREEFDAVYDTLAADGLPLKADRDQAWRDFAGWRVNYDAVLLALCSMTMAPYAPWSSDRSPNFSLMRVRNRRRR
jgi:nitrogen fixation-related uncharacterized protein